MKKIFLTTFFIIQLILDCSDENYGKDLLNVSWELFSLKNAPQPIQYSSENDNYLLKFKSTKNKYYEGVAHGSDGCNSFSSPYKIFDENTIEFQGLTMTKMACRPYPALADDFLEILKNSINYIVNNLQLKLFYNSNQFELVFKGSPPVEN